ncbi:MAG TPA: M20 family metallopeptidase [Trebonia sp.]|jgi:amidohydrolase|nr:M20 family metallopeptidase [Trebonia sp.]
MSGLTADTGRAPDTALTEIGAGVREQVTAISGDLLAMSHAIHERPELRFEEHHASELLQRFLAGEGFDVRSGLAGMPTAFRAERTFGADGPGGAGGGPVIAVFCEFDALPGIGHACGHNIIATAGAGAAASAARWLAGAGPDGDGRPAGGTLVVLGSPGEEGGGGKVRLIEAGELAGIDAAIMVHPAGFDSVARTNLGRMSLRATFSGRASHAAAAPELGRNALDAATLLLVAIGLLRQQVRGDSRIHAKVAEGGDSINVIPERSVVELFIRSPDSEYLRGRLLDAVRDCVAGSALATGTTWELEEPAPAYDPVLPNHVLAELAAAAFAEVGRDVDPSAVSGNAGSTDMGNVSQAVPSLHPYLQVVPGLAIHTREFAEAARGEAGDRAVVDGAGLLGIMTGALLTRPALVAAAAAEFDQREGS